MGDIKSDRLRYIGKSIDNIAALNKESVFPPPWDGEQCEQGCGTIMDLHMNARLPIIEKNRIITDVRYICQNCQNKYVVGSKSEDGNSK